jgi:enoyl-CoA hydratase
MESENILYKKRDGITIITINRPKALNALNEETIPEFLSRLKAAEEDRETRVIVITGAGEKAFCAGLDLKTAIDITVTKAVEMSRLGQELTIAVEELGKPVIAAINGYALGGGLEPAMACDIRIASEKARIGQTEVNVGLIPGWGGTQRLPRLVGKGIAKELIFTGKMIDAKTAERIGLINLVVPPDKLESTVEELANEIMSKPPIALKLAKELINNSIETDQRTGLIHEAEAFGILSSTEDYKEGVSAFIEKRKPDYKGR